MPRRPPSACTTPGCPALVDSPGPCPAHFRERGMHLRRHKSVYDSARWQRLRARTLREEPRCRACGRPGEHVDHVIALSAGGAPYDRRNVQTLCRACHTAKTNTEPNFFGSR